MNAKTIGPLLFFIGTGIYATVNDKIETDDLVHVFLNLVIWTTGLYYFYVNAATEAVWGDRIDEPKWRKRFEDFLITVQFLCFEGLWFLVERKYGYYAIDIVVLNLSYIAWDFVYKDLIKQKKGRIIFVFDLLGLIVSICLASCTAILPPPEINTDGSAHQAMWVVIFSAVLIYHSIIGFVISATQFKFNPFYLNTTDTKPQ